VGAGHPLWGAWVLLMLLAFAISIVFTLKRVFSGGVCLARVAIGTTNSGTLWPKAGQPQVRPDGGKACGRRYVSVASAMAIACSSVSERASAQAAANASSPRAARAAATWRS
jgi:hypothetical protein